MKKLVLLFAMTIVTAAMSFAQLEEGHIAYDIEMSSDDPEIASMASMFNGSSMNLYFATDLARTELSFGSMMSISTVVNSNTDEVLLMMGGMMGNKAVLTNSTEMSDGEEEEKAEMTWTFSKKKKKILGYKCKKAIGKDADGDEVVYWYTTKIKTANTDPNSALAQLPGMALEYEVDREGMTMIFTASKVETSLDAATKKSKFSFEIPEGYTEMTYEEFSNMGM